MTRDAEVDRAYAHGMKDVLRHVWPHVGHDDRNLAACLQRLEAMARTRLVAAANETKAA